MPGFYWDSVFSVNMSPLHSDIVFVWQFLYLKRKYLNFVWVAYLLWVLCYEGAVSEYEESREDARVGRLKMREWKNRHGRKCGVEKVGVETSARFCRGRKCRSGKISTILQGWKMQEWKHQERQCRRSVFRIKGTEQGCKWDVWWQDHEHNREFNFLPVWNDSCALSAANLEPNDRSNVGNSGACPIWPVSPLNFVEQRSWCPSQRKHCGTRPIMDWCPCWKKLSQKCCIDEKSLYVTPTIHQILEGTFVIVSPSPNIGGCVPPHLGKDWYCRMWTTSSVTYNMHDTLDRLQIKRRETSNTFCPRCNWLTFRKAYLHSVLYEVCFDICSKNCFVVFLAYDNDLRFLPFCHIFYFSSCIFDCYCKHL